MRQQRRLTLIWKEAEVSFYDLLNEEANEANQTIGDYIKNILKSKNGF